MVDPDELHMVKGADMTRILEAARRVGRELNREDPFVDDERFAALAAEMPDIHDLIKNCFDDAFVIREEKLVEFGEEVFRNNQLLTLEGMEKIRFVDVACFAGSRAIRTLVGLGPQLVDLPRDCFKGCLCLETLRGCERVRTIGVRCFEGCKKLETLEGLGRAVRELPERCFGNTGIKNLRGIEHVRTIGAGCFEGCKKLETLEGLGRAVRELPHRCFANTGIKNLRGIEHVRTSRSRTRDLGRTIGAGCFEGCKKLETLEGLGRAVRELPHKCFANTGIKNLRGIEHVREIGAWCFSECRDLHTLEGLGPAVRELPERCFAHTGVTNLRGMQHVRVLGPDCFRDCKELASAEGLGPAVRVLPRSCFARTGIQTLRGMQHVRVLGPDCFRDCKELASAEGLSLDRDFEIARPLRLHSYQEGHAFAGCTKLLPLSLAAPDASPAAVLEYLRMKVRPPSRYAFLACVAYARREQDAGRGFRLDPLLGDIAGRLPDDIIREFVLPFLLGTLETEAGALVLREMGESHFAAGEYDDALDYYRRSLDVSLHISYANALTNALSDARTVLVERMEAVSVALPGGGGENARSVVADAKRRVQRWVEEEEARAHTLYLQYQEKKRRREEKRKEAELRHGDAVKLRKLGRFEEAVDNFEAAIEMKRAGNAEQWSIRTSISLLAATHKDMGNAEEAAELRALAKSMPFA